MMLSSAQSCTPLATWVRKKIFINSHNPESVLTQSLGKQPPLYKYTLQTKKNLHAECLSVYIYTQTDKVAENSLECALATKTLQKLETWQCSGIFKINVSLWAKCFTRRLISVTWIKRSHRPARDFGGRHILVYRGEATMCEVWFLNKNLELKRRRKVCFHFLQLQGFIMKNQKLPWVWRSMDTKN